MIQNGFGGFAGKVPISVINEINRRGGIGLGFRLKDELIVFGEPVGDDGSEIAGIAFFTGIRVVGETDSAGFRADDRLPLPVDLAESLDTTMEVAGDTAGVVVGGQFVVGAVDRKFAFCDTVSVAAHGDAEVVWVFQPALERVLPERDVGNPAVTIRGVHGRDDCAIFAKPNFNSGCVRQREETDGLTFVGGPVGSGFQSGELVEDFNFNSSILTTVGFAGVGYGWFGFANSPELEASCLNSL